MSYNLYNVVTSFIVILNVVIPLLVHFVVVFYASVDWRIYKR